MSEKISLATCYHMFELSGFTKPDEEQIKKVQADLENILAVMDEFSKVELNEAEATVNVTVNQSPYLRKDEIIPTPGAENILQNAPQAVYGHFFAVPKVIDEN